jgi:hypothetical protein
MADTKVSGLSAVAAFATTQEFPVNDSGTSKKITGTQLRAAFPDGTMAYVQVTANQTGISAVTDLTSLTVTVTPAASRRLRVKAYVRLIQNTSAATPIVSIKEGATILNQAVVGLAIGGQATLHVEAILTPTAAAHTYKITLETGLGTVDLLASATNPSFILCEDIYV